MVIVDNVHKSFGPVHAVQGVSFEMKPGQITGLLGPNGAGKTTTIRMITGYLLPDIGRVLIGGLDTLESGAKARCLLGYMPESTPLYTEMKVREYLDFRGRLYGLHRALRVKAVEYAIARCYLGDVRSRRIGVLSKGYRQRVGLASAIMHNPKVLVLDEPTNGLDPAQITETRALVKELAQERTMLVSTHILPEVEKLCDRVVVIAGGKVRASGTPAELMQSGGNAYVVQAGVASRDAQNRFTAALSNIGFAQSVDVRGTNASGLGVSWVEWVVRAKPGAPDFREAIAAEARKLDLAVRELRSENATLEHVFVRLMEQGDEPGEKDAA